MIYDGWREEYDNLLQCLARALSPTLHHEELTFELISYRFTAKAKEIIHARFPHCRLDLDASRRQIKWGRYGHKKFIYPAEELQRLWCHLRARIAHYFPAAVIEYET